MKRNSFLLFVAILFTSVSVSFAQKKLSILGDSYSTYYGYVTPTPTSVGMAYRKKREKMM